MFQRKPKFKRVNNLEEAVEVSGEAQLPVAQYDLYSKAPKGEGLTSVAKRHEVLNEFGYRSVRNLFVDYRLYKRIK